VQFRMNFIGLNVQKKPAALRFYRGLCGMQVKESAKPPMLWLTTTGMNVEVFTAQARDQSFNHPVPGQALRPCIHVRNLQAIAESLKKKRAVVGEVEKTAQGRRVECVGPENIRWLMAEGRGYTHADGLTKPHIGSADLRVIDMEGQIKFFTNILGLKQGVKSGGQITLRDLKEGTFLLLGKDQREKPGEGFPAQPAFLSFAVPKATEAEKKLQSLGVQFVQALMVQDFGIDMLILDADRNIIQIVEYK
jgi:predicted enzyme related to lactoylglutathione lyase